MVAAVFEANQNSPALLELVDDSIWLPLELVDDSVCSIWPVVAAVFEANQNSPARLELVDDSICYLACSRRSLRSQPKLTSSPGIGG